MEAAAGSPPAGGAAGTSAPSGQGGPSGGQQGGDDPFAERPELFVGGAFVGGLALAILLRRLGS
jgi:hypothetical protein